MRYTISFPIRNRVLAVDPFPLKDEDRVFFVNVEGLFMSRVGITFPNASPETAFKIVNLKQPEKPTTEVPKFEIRGPINPYRNIAIGLVRSWQAILSPYSLIDVDFSNPTEDFQPENDEKSDVLKFTAGKKEVTFGLSNYTIYARAFYISKNHHDLIEPSHFYIEGNIAAYEGRYVHAYNSHFLMLESLYGNGKYAEKDIVSAFLLNQEFMDAFSSGLSDTLEFLARNKRPVPFGMNNLNDAKETISSIVKLRGKLRHHSTKNKGKWDPTSQETYKDEELILASICQNALRNKSKEKLWSEEAGREVMKQAHDSGVKMTCQLEVTLIENDFPRVISLGKITFPATSITSELALSALSHSIELIREKLAGTQIMCIRCFNTNNGVEVFRYSFSAPPLRID